MGRGECKRLISLYIQSGTYFCRIGILQTSQNASQCNAEGAGYMKCGDTGERVMWGSPACSAPRVLLGRYKWRQNIMSGLFPTSEKAGKLLLQ